jgi:hypothetical protein
MPQNVNIINGETKGDLAYPAPGQPTPINAVKYISIGWSNYGEVFVVADKRMPNTIFVLFRGTYSAKTAALYSKPTSAVPLTVCNDTAGKPEQFLYGIFKATSEMIHTIVESVRYLATDFLGATKPNSVKIFTTGHSLGGAMCTDFAYLWVGIKKTAPYNTGPYNVLADNIVCVSLGAPRCMSSSVAQKFCNLVSIGKILYLRITTNGDPITGVPLKLGYQHPCSEDEQMRQKISVACRPQSTMIPTPSVDYAGDLNCINYKGRPYLHNGFSHAFYLYIKYLNALDIVSVFKGMVTQREVERTPDRSTVCRLIMGQNGNYYAIFFDVNKARATPNNIDSVQEAELSKVDPNASAQLTGGGLFDRFSSKPPVQVKATPVDAQTAPVLQSTAQGVTQPQKKMFGGPVAEDVRMTSSAFNSLIQQMVQIQGDLCPLKGKMFSPFDNQIMPDLSCPGSKISFGGKYKRKSKKNKSKKNKSRRNYTSRN